MAATYKPTIPAIDRLMSRVSTGKSGCWEWQGPTNRYGYGNINVGIGGRRMAKIHRVSYEYFRGAIPVGLELDHLCSNRRCINPDHLEPVTHLENVRRGGHKNRGKPECIRGHPFTGPNLYVAPDGERACNACRRARVAARARKRADA